MSARTRDVTPRNAFDAPQSTVCERLVGQIRLFDKRSELLCVLYPTYKGVKAAPKTPMKGIVPRKRRRLRAEDAQSRNEREPPTCAAKPREHDDKARRGKREHDIGEPAP